MQASNPTAPSTSGSTPPLTQPSGLGHNSFAIPPHLLPYLRQPYPPNLIPYNPFVSHLLYAPHRSAIFRPKYITPAAYNCSAPAFTSGNSNSAEDLMAAELKENNGFLVALKQNEEAHTWTTTPGRDLSTLPTNYFYNIPPGQNLAFPHPHTTHGPPFPGVYHLNSFLSGSIISSIHFSATSSFRWNNRFCSSSISSTSFTDKLEQQTVESRQAMMMESINIP
ncbi:hypothetical protein LIER_43768 [Lithospermum erythrorhizon]|uniref:Uncharacterized protein n=1 Tax=Lithospermum erythrorhizon TaxID=34254 RepID=A0AAV3QU38_LITER